MLQCSSVGNGRPTGGVPVREGCQLEHVDPKRFAVEDMNHLGAESGEAEPLELLRVRALGEGQQVVEHNSETCMRPAVQFTNAGDGEQRNPQG
jgi:hypothetical protein